MSMAVTNVPPPASSSTSNDDLQLPEYEYGVEPRTPGTPTTTVPSVTRTEPVVVVVLRPAVVVNRSSPRIVPAKRSHPRLGSALTPRGQELLASVLSGSTTAPLPLTTSTTTSPAGLPGTTLASTPTPKQLMPSPEGRRQRRTARGKPGKAAASAGAGASAPKSFDFVAPTAASPVPPSPLPLPLPLPQGPMVSHATLTRAVGGVRTAQDALDAREMIAIVPSQPIIQTVVQTATPQPQLPRAAQPVPVPHGPVPHANEVAVECAGLRRLFCLC